MKIHLIYGKSDAGKTTTCRKLLKTLLAFGASLRFYETFGDSDFYALLTIGDKTVGIYSAGDEKSHLRYALNFGRERNCDVLVAVVSYYKHYSDLLDGMEEDKDYWWHTLEKGNDSADKRNYSNQIVLVLLNTIIGTNN